ncbi:tau 95 subunit of transcription factor TFIIIC [Aspergillus brasiliensis]|uniref:Tau 95 subunit of transcription factor TFIIIC n=1 Tax=Aspergillus brasiliensis TaxID=319629 RepID=A0A9W5YYR3_9EURO|nr:tau 95 subunit of transcription factor TFIIIC [Aspergillus brasiliensis]GKZ48925.1 tau 95 subunit of transcription factor TFIIIC [Aspergillus brasiliensis]
MTDQHGARTAPFYQIPSRRIVSVEHPAIIRNLDKAVDTLKGDAGITKILHPPKPDSPAQLLLRPEDAMSRPLQSTSLPSNNILLKVTVPKRTGRKRKRGSNEPFSGVAVSTVHTEPQRRSARELLRSLSDNVSRYQVEPVGLVNRTHVFRGMPDFVFSTGSSSFVNRFREQILPFDYDKMKHFDLDMSKGAITDVDIIPPPSFSFGDIPFTYIYRQNPTVRQAIDNSGNITTVNTQRVVKVLTHLVSYDIGTVPTSPRTNCPPIHTLDKTLQETISAVEALFQQRPAWTRRGLRNSLPTIEQRYALRHAIPYVGYIFRSGPWRDAIIKYGHDPRTDPSYRIYQTAMFRILPREADVARDGYTGRRHAVARAGEVPQYLDETHADQQQTETQQLPTTTHLFTGCLPLPRDGRMWMFCDVTDPTLRSILFPNDPHPPPAGFLREECDIVTDGWFGNGTLAKTKTIMRAKILALLDDKLLDDEVEFTNILKLPDHATPESVMVDFWLDPAVASQREMMMATEVRGIIKGAPAWKERVGGAGAGSGGKRGVGGRDEVGDEGDGKGKGKKRADRRVQFQDEVGADGEGGGEMSEGEEEAYEQEELAEAVAEATASVGGEEDDDDDVDDEDEDEEQSDEDGEDEDTEMGGVETPRATRRKA